MMFGIGFIMMILVLGLPVVLVVAVVALTWVLNKRASEVASPSSQQPPSARAPWHSPPGQVCSHCGTGLQTGWSHCPQCGAPVNLA